MSSVESRREMIVSLGAAATVGIAGCRTTENTTTESGSGNESQYSGVSNERAKEIALEAEFGYVEDQLANADCLADWGTSGSAVQEEAAIDYRTSEGVYVDVVVGYWTATRNMEGDSGSEARYFVTRDETERVDGTDISPCANATVR
ncbi:hypothetical protein ACOZ4N_17940 [Halorientalis pallida]|uniref:hypothetical protein n=1 Tax=Halorientalis pallida TaxID=2479928 RepID=UPI003C6FFF78